LYDICLAVVVAAAPSVVTGVAVGAPSDGRATVVVAAAVVAAAVEAATGFGAREKPPAAGVVLSF